MLSSLSLPTPDFVRNLPIPAVGREHDYHEKYDFSTLFYDAFWHDGVVILVCPRLLNFKALLDQMSLRLDGTHADIRGVHHRRRYDVIVLRSPQPPYTLSVELDGWYAEVTVGRCAHRRFAGKNVHVAISRNNDLNWIRDFAVFHRRMHGLQAMILFDNGSDRYAPAEVAEVVRRAGLDDVLVIPAPLPFGPLGLPPYRGKSNYLQAAVLNIARLRFLARARAVLVADIDELVLGRGRSVFDAAVQSPLGLVSFAGDWHYPHPHDAGPARHAQHIYRVPDTRGRTPKYCIAPTGPLRRLGWEVHKPEGFPFGKLLRSRTIRYMHCRMISTGWKSYNRCTMPDVVRPSPQAQDAMADAFGITEAP